MPPHHTFCGNPSEDKVALCNLSTVLLIQIVKELGISAVEPNVPVYALACQQLFIQLSL